MTLSRPPLLILGGGCAGVAVARALRGQGWTEPLVLIDRRPPAAFARDVQRWCFWSDGRDGTEGSPPVEFLVSHRWSSWELRPAGGGLAHRQEGPSRSYAHIEAAEYFRRLHCELAAEPEVELCFGPENEVAAVHSDADGAVVTLAGGREFRGRGVVDARHMGSGRLGALAAEGETLLWQSFVGRIVHSPQPAFDPAVATLMDFSEAGIRDGKELDFFYVLPFSPTEALVEATVFAPAPADPQRLEARLRAHLDKIAPGATTGDRECGVLPMATASLDPAPGPNQWVAGVAAGAARPSSGYAFLRIQRQAARLAEAIRGEMTPAAARRHLRAGFPLMHRALDRVFLHLLATRPVTARVALTRLFARVSGERCARFLGEESTLRDLLAVIAALPKLPFLRAAAETLAASARKLVLRSLSPPVSAFHAASSPSAAIPAAMDGDDHRDPLQHRGP